MPKPDKQYEAMFLFGTAAAAEVEGSVDTIRQLVERHGGSILVCKKWDERKLTYEIEKQKRGLYVICYYSAPNTTNSLITRDVNLSDTLLRVLITDAGHLSQEEMQAVEPQVPEPRQERPAFGGFGDRPSFDDRGDRGDRGDRPSRPRREESDAAAATA